MFAFYLQNPDAGEEEAEEEEDVKGEETDN